MKDKMESLGWFTAFVGVDRWMDSEAVCWRRYRQRYELDVQHHALYPGLHSFGLCNTRHYRKVFQEFSNK